MEHFIVPACAEGEAGESSVHLQPKGLALPLSRDPGYCFTIQSVFWVAEQLPKNKAINFQPVRQEMQRSCLLGECLGPRQPVAKLER